MRVPLIDQAGHAAPPLMKKCLLFAFTVLSLLFASAQENTAFVLPVELQAGNMVPRAKLRQQNYGAILGLQRGRNTAIELGYEMHWRKIALKQPHIWGATTNLEYNFGHNIVGYKAGVWRKQGRVNLTYGANLGYFTDFKGGNQFGIGPAVGFRLMGLHLVNGYNLLLGNMEPTKNGEKVGANTLYMSLRYYFPTKNRFVWDRNGKKSYGLLGLKKDNRERKGLFGKKEEPEERKGLFRKKQEPEPEPERKGLFGGKKKKDPEPEQPKGLRGIFQRKDQ